MSKKEKEEIEVIEEKPKKPKRKSRGTGKFFLGWFLGTIINLVLIVGFGFWAYKNVTISSIEKTFGFEISVLSEDSKHLTVDKLVGNVIEVASNFDSMTIEELSDGLGLGLSDMLVVETVDGEKTYSFKGLDITAVIKGKLKDAGDNMQTVIDDLSLGDIESTFGITLPNYEFINSLKDTPLKDLSSAADGLLDNYTLNKLSDEFGVSFNSVSMLESLLDIPFSQLPTEMQNLKVKDVIDTTSATGVLKAIADYKINELDTELPNLKLGALFTESEVNGNIILKRLKDATISGLNTEINNITINELYPDSTNKIIVALGSYKVTNLTAAFEGLKLKDVIDMEKKANTSYNPATDPAYKQYEAQGVWAYIDGETYIKDMASISPNLAEIKLGELQYQGLIDQGLDLTKIYDGVALSEYTMNGFLNKVIADLA